MENLETTYLGLKLRNPLIAGSCGLTNSISNIKELAKKGVGAIVIKSLFEEQIQAEAEKVIKNNTQAESNRTTYLKQSSTNEYMIMMKLIHISMILPNEILLENTCIS